MSDRHHQMSDPLPHTQHHHTERYQAARTKEDSIISTAKDMHNEGDLAHVLSQVADLHQYAPKFWTKHAAAIESEFDRNRERLGFPNPSIG